MWARGRAESGFTTIELLLAVLVGSVGIISLVGTLDVSRRVTSYSEMKEAASHVAEQKMEELRAIRYGKLALNGNPSPAGSTDADEPPYFLSTNAAGTPVYRWNQAASAPAGHTEPLVIDAAAGSVPATAEPWTDGRTRGTVYRYVTCATTEETDDECDQGPATTAYKRITVAVTVDNKFGPKEPILTSTLVGNPETNAGEGQNPLESPNTQCVNDLGQLVECTQSVPGAVHTYYLYDTPATNLARQDIVGSHPTHPTVAPSGTCTSGDSGGCPVPDLMAADPPPSPTVMPPLYNYSSEITGGSTPGGAVVRRDTSCDGSVTTTDNTKGHMWVTPPLAEDMTLSGDAAMSVSSQTFNGASAGAGVCVSFLNVPGDMSNLVATPPAVLGVASHTRPSWPKTPANVGFALDFLGSAPAVTIPAGNRLGVRIWTASSSGADLVFLYDHPLHASLIQVNEPQ